MITLFKEITTEDALVKIEKESEKWDGLYCDLEIDEERKFVKEQLKGIEDLRKKLNRARIDLSKNYKVEVEKEAATIDARLVAANKPFTELLEEYQIKRTAQLAAIKEKEKEVAEELAKKELSIKVENEHEIGLLLNEKFDRDLADELKKSQELLRKQVEKNKIERLAREKKIAEDAAAQARVDEEAKTAKAIQDKLDAEEATKQAVIDKKVAEELAVKQREASDERARVAKIKSAKDAEEAAERARLAEVKRQKDNKELEDDKRLRAERNQEFRAKGHRDIKEQLMKDTGIDEETAIKVVKSMIKMDRVTINYL